MNRLSSAFLALSAAALVLAAGCSKQATLDPKVVAEHRSRLELAEEPDGAQTVLEVRQVMFGDEPAEEHEHEHEHANGEHAHEDHADHEEADHEDADHDDADHDDADHDDADHDHADHDHADDAGDDVEIADKTPVISEMDVVLVGAVGGVPNPSDQAHPDFPFTEGKAAFFLADPEAVAETEEHAHEHAPGEECAFCAARAGDSTDMLAVVQFADEHGKPLAVDARELFNLKEKETVVVRGKATIGPGGMLTVNATGLYVRR